MQGVVDSNYMFTDVSVKLPGSTHDATVFKESGLFKNSSTLIPRHTKLINGVETPLFLIGDPAYPLLPWLIKPYTGSLNAAEESFNCHLSSARIVVENAFGRLKGRWRCLTKRIDVNPTFVPQVVLACAILHNFVEQQKESYLEIGNDVAICRNEEKGRTARPSLSATMSPMRRKSSDQALPFVACEVARRKIA
ncbi:protein ALP1-like [Rhagoletis pomonella]|uniref:protein ALP1-like n=1 Tax=Rhagoletis pomonella TaxID=28610 RepID=UPI00177B14F0|nr:protein ALP1-like [Rhagoletis pomonella]